MSSQDYRQSHLHKGEDYERMFREDPHTEMIWRMEQAKLQAIIAEAFPAGPPRHLDFACGTGRIIGVLNPLTSESIGVDISPSMLEVAKQRNPGVRFELADLTRDDVLAGEQFDLITAFRFFPNAQPSLRAEVMAVLRDKLRPGGILIFNDHMNSDSWQTSAVRLTRRDLGHSMSMQEVDELVADSGMRIKAKHGIARVPFTGGTFKHLAPVYEKAERALDRWGAPAARAQDVLVVATPA